MSGRGTRFWTVQGLALVADAALLAVILTDPARSSLAALLGFLIGNQIGLFVFGRRPEGGDRP